VQQLILVCAIWMSRRGRWHPIGFALGAAVGLDMIARSVALPARVDLALWLATPVLSAWCAWRVLGDARSAKAALLAASAQLALSTVVYMAPCPRAWWGLVPLAVRCSSIALQVEAARSWRRAARPADSADAGTLGLLAGDALSLLGPAGLVFGPWWIASLQAALVALGVAAVVVTRGSRSVW
jgi:hypothetical protein